MDDVIDASVSTTAMTAHTDQNMVVERSHTDAMDMTSFVQWMGTNFGTLSVMDALQQAAFMLCCDVISQDIGKAPLRLITRPC